RLLQERLVRRGVTLSALLVALDLARHGAKGSAATIKATAGVAGAYGARGCASGGGSAPVVASAQGGTPAPVLPKVKVPAALALLLGLAVASAGALFEPPVARPPDGEVKAGPEAAKAKPAAETKETDKYAEVSGKVLGPDGKPVKGAKLYLQHYGPKGRELP